MPRTLVGPVADITRAGVLADDTGADGSYSTADSPNGNVSPAVNYPGNEAIFLHVVNTTGTPYTAAVPTNQATVEGVTTPIRTITVAANSQVFFGPLALPMNLQVDGTLWLNVQSTTMKLKLFRLPVR